MPLKDEAKKEYQRKYMKLKRSNKSVELGAGDVRPFSKGAFAMLDPDTDKYPAILRALVDPEKRVKLEKIYQSLKDFKQAENVYYGCGKGSIPFDLIGDYLEVTK